MSLYGTKFYAVWDKFCDTVASVQWTALKARVTGGPGYNLLPEDFQKIKDILRGGNYVILSHRKTELTTMTIGAMSYIKTGKWPDYGHAFMNLDVGDPSIPDGFKIMEATSPGVHYSDFMEVFNCDSVCILRPKNVTKQDWDEILAALPAQLGKPYDDLFNLTDASHVSCVEMVLDALRADDDYLKNFPNLEAAIKKVGNLTPQMYRDCPDFEVVFEIKR